MVNNMKIPKNWQKEVIDLATAFSGAYGGAFF